MTSMRLFPLCCTLLALTLSADALAEKNKKLYRWTDENGKVHYTDQLPPEAASAARDQLNNSGMAVDSVARALTPEERAIADAEAERVATAARLAAEKEKMDAILIASYPTEADLARAYKERFDLLDRSVESAKVGIQSQEKSLTDMLAHAAGLEREGKPVPKNIVESIGRTRTQVGSQRDFLAKREAERVELQKEFDGAMARYRELTAERAAAARERAAK
jgi:hypothetical protein